MALSSKVPRHKLAHKYFLDCDLLHKLAHFPLANNRCNHLSCSSYWAPMEFHSNRRKREEWTAAEEDEVL